MTFLKKSIYFLFLSFLLFSVDRFFKILIVSFPKISILQIGDFKIYFEFFKNYYLALGLVIPKFFILFINFLAVIFLGVVISLKFKNKDSQNLFSFFLILSGALSNFWDRLYYGYVIDYINVGYGDFLGPIFNFADVWVFLGIILAII